MSAVASVSTSGVFVTWTPRVRHAARSTLSKPTTAFATTRSLGARGSRSSSTRTVSSAMRPSASARCAFQSSGPYSSPNPSSREIAAGGSLKVVTIVDILFRAIGWTADLPRRVGGGKGEGEGTSDARCRVDPDATAVAIHDRPGDREPQPGARPACSGAFALPVGFEYPLQVRAVDTGSGVGDTQANPARPVHLRLQVNGPASRRELQRVGQQVHQNLLDPAGVDEYIGEIGFHARGEIDRAFGGEAGVAFDRHLEEPANRVPG